MRKGDKVKAWLDRNDLPAGSTYANVTHIRNINQISKYLGRNNAVALYLINEYGKKELYAVLRSGMKQRKLCGVVKKKLKTTRCGAEDSEMLYDFEEALEQRSVHVFNIIQDAVRLTDAYPYFRAVGYAELIDFTKKWTGDDSANKRLSENIKAYNEAHPDEVREYMQSIEHELRMIEERRARIKQAEEDEKAAKKRAKQMLKEEAEEIRKNEAAHRRRQQIIDRSFERYFK